ncbi:MAG: homocysteine S-methyltransferase family protein [Arhodomonas sp.]|nr:homocysteine S-methyltransferase family protein [Arhodomonas sp.]
MAKLIGEFADDGFLNIVGGCCGTTPEHIARHRRGSRRHQAARQIPERAPAMRLSGLEPLNVDRRHRLSSMSASAPTSPAQRQVPAA